MEPFYSTILGQWYVGSEDGSPVTGPFDSQSEAQEYIDSAAGRRFSDDLDRALAAVAPWIAGDTHSKHWVHLAGQQ